MKPIVFFEVDGYISCDIVGASSYGDCLSLARYFKKYWRCGVEEVFDTGFSAKFKVTMPERCFFMTHDSQAGNYLSAPGGDINIVIPDILSDLNDRLK